MTKTPIPKPTLRVGKMRLRGRIFRDLFNTHGTVVIDELDVDADIGGDAVKTEPTRRKRKDKKKSLRGVARKAITHTFAAAIGISGMVAASGIAFALGW